MMKARKREYMVRIVRASLVTALVFVAPHNLWAQASETSVLDGSEITFYHRDGLTQEEIITLRLVMTNRQLLEILVPGGEGYSALAVSPDDGFIRDGKPVSSASGRGGLPTAAAAAAAALQACEAAKAGKAACQVVLAVGPSGKR